MTIANAIANFFGSNLVKSNKVHPRVQIFIGGAITVVGVWISSYLTSYGAFQFCFAVSHGFGTGLFYSTVLYKAWIFFPGKEGLITGIVIAGFGIGGFLFTELSTAWCNPMNVDSNQDIIKTDPNSKYFPMSVA